MFNYIKELLGYVLQHEWRLSKERRQGHLNTIKSKCSPKILYENDYFKIMAESNSNINQLNKNIDELKMEINELKNIIKSNMSPHL